MPCAEQVVDRVRWKAATYGQDAAAPAQPNGPAQPEGHSGNVPRYKVAPETVAMLYDKWVMPMTKQVQVRRAGHPKMRTVLFVCGMMSLRCEGCAFQHVVVSFSSGNARHHLHMRRSSTYCGGWSSRMATMHDTDCQLCHSNIRCRNNQSFNFWGRLCADQMARVLDYGTYCNSWSASTVLHVCFYLFGAHRLLVV